MANGVNKVILIGNLGADPEMRYTANGSAQASFRMGVSRSYMQGETRKEETEWVSVVVWGKLAEVCGQHLSKGRQVYVDGRLSTRSWDDKEGKKHYRTEVVANEVTFLGGGREPVPAGNIDADDLPFDT